MNSILLVTVGGSHAPILRSIEQNRPKHVYFLCSDDTDKAKGSYVQVIGEGTVLKSRPGLPNPDLPNIATLADLRDGQFDIEHIKRFDDLNDCYLAAARLIDQLHRNDPEANLIVDYTGGTKSMTAGLAAAALDDGRCEMQLVTGLRSDLEKVTDRTEFARPVRVWDLQVHRRLQLVRQFLDRFDYGAAARMLEKTARRYSSEATEEQLTRWLTLCRAFDAWDRFDHDAARGLLQSVRGVADPYKAFLNILAEHRGHGFEPVEDLLRNAERRAAQQRYDDAVGRLYRALELTAQLWLKDRHGIDTGNVQLECVPDAYRQKLARHRDEKGVIKIGLLAAWDLIAGFPDDVLGCHFRDQRQTLLDFLSVRNESLFAHGLTPIEARDYGHNAKRIVEFVEEVIERAITAQDKRRIAQLRQFPTDWE